MSIQRVAPQRYSMSISVAQSPCVPHSPLAKTKARLRRVGGARRQVDFCKEPGIIDAGAHLIVVLISRRGKSRLHPWDGMKPPFLVRLVGAGRPNQPVITSPGTLRCTV